MNYLFSAGNIGDTKKFINAANRAQIPTSLSGELMNFEEAVKAMAVEEYTEDTKQKGIQKGMEQGHLEKMQEISLNLIREGTETVFIAKVTGLTIAEVENLKNAEHLKQQ